MIWAMAQSWVEIQIKNIWAILTFIWPRQGFFHFYENMKKNQQKLLSDDRRTYTGACTQKRHT